MGQNETKLHFEARNLDADMRKAGEELASVTPQQHASRLAIENISMLVLLAIIGVAACFMLGVF